MNDSSDYEYSMSDDAGFNNSSIEEDSSSEEDQLYYPQIPTYRFCWEIQNFQNITSDTCSSTFSTPNLDVVLSFKFDNNSNAWCSVSLSNIHTTLRVQYSLVLFNFATERNLTAEQNILCEEETSHQDFEVHLSRRDMLSASSGWINSDGAVKLEIHIASTPYVVPDFSGKNSKKETGYVGLKNLGATCYMSSMLQSLFHIPAFRRIVYEMPTTGAEDSETCIPLCLQRLFCQMQFRDVPCSTKDLTRSFGWTEEQIIWQQHDIQEFCRVLIDKLEMKMKGTSLENAIPEIFKGKYRSYLRCKNVKYESSKEEEFYDLSMLVKNCKNLEESFKKYVEPEELNGKNQYQTEEFGKQDAVMGVEFIEFPSVLQLHLRRFEYDFNYERMIKINDKFEFPPEIDLSPYLAKDVVGNSEDNESESHENAKSNIYDLYGVLVHLGNVETGHYYAFLRTSTNPQWYKFDDNCVTKEEADSAIRDNYGGFITGKQYGNRIQKVPKSYSAYMLVYVCRDDAEQIFQEITDEEVPKHLIDYVHHVEKEERLKKEKKKEELNSFTLKIINKTDIEEHNLKGQTGFPKEGKTPPIKLQRDKTIEEVYHLVANILNIDDVNKIRIWKTNFPSCNPVKILKIKNGIFIDSIERGYFQTEATIYVEEKDVDEPLYIQDKIVLYVKFFFPNASAPIQYIGNIKVDETSKLIDATPLVNNLLGFPESTPLLFFLETVGGTTKKFDSELTFKDNNIFENGTIIICQVKPEIDFPQTSFIPKDPLPNEHDQYDNYNDKDTVEEESNETKDIKLISQDDIFPTKIEYVDQYLDKKKNTFDADIYNDNEPSTPLFTLRFFLGTINLKDLKELIAKAAEIEFDPSHDSMLLYLIDSMKSRPIELDQQMNSPSRSHYSIFTSPYRKRFKQKGAHPKILFHLFQGINEASLSKLSNYPIVFSSDGYNIEKKTKILEKKKTNCKNIFEKLIQQLKQESPNANIDIDIGHYRFLQIENGQIIAELAYTQIFNSSYYSYYTILISFIPQDQRALIDEEFLITFSFYGFSNETFPLTIKVITGEKFSETKERISNILKDQQLADFKNSTFQLSNKRKHIIDSDILSDIANDGDKIYAISKKSSLSESSIKILN